MKVKELIEQLSDIDPEREVIMAKDAEGNEYSPLSDMSEMSYCAETTWSGYVGLEKLTEGDKKFGYTEDDVVEGVPCLVLHPVN